MAGEMTNSSYRKILPGLNKFLCLSKGACNRCFRCILIFVLFSILITGSLIAREDKTVMVLNSDGSIEKYLIAHTEFKSRIDVAEEIDIGSKWLDEKEIKKKIVEADPDIIFCIGSRAYQMAYKMKRDKKLVFSLVINWKRFPAGKNVYGVSNELPPIMQLSMYRYFFPEVNKIGVLYSKEYNAEWFKNAVRNAREVGIEIIGMPVVKSDDMKSDLNKLLPEVDAVWLIPDPLVIRDIESVNTFFETSDEAKKPIFAYDKTFVHLGATLITAADIQTMGKQAVRIVRQMLTEEEISERVQEPAGSFNILNMKKVNRYGLQFNIEALDSVNEIIK